jgi:hypothetical protein
MSLNYGSQLINGWINASLNKSFDYFVKTDGNMKKKWENRRKILFRISQEWKTLFPTELYVM